MLRVAVTESVWCALLATLLTANADAQKLPSPIIVQGLSPDGLRISVPDTIGITAVNINANVNFPIAEEQIGQVRENVAASKNGYWSLEASDITLKQGDVVFFKVRMTAGEKTIKTGGHRAIYELVDWTCGPSPTTVNGRSVCAGKLLLDDNFDTFNTLIWKHSIQFANEPDSDFATYTNDPVNSFVKDGLLHIKTTVLTEDELRKTTKLKGCTWTRGGEQFCERRPNGDDILPPTRSAMLTTKDTFSFKFGRLDIRARAAAGDWLRSRIMLEPQRKIYGDANYQSGCVQLLSARNSMEWAGRNEPQYDVATCRREMYYYKYCDLPAGKNYSNDFHVFSLRWTPVLMTISYDGVCEHNAPPEGGFLKHDYIKPNCHGSTYERGSILAPFDHEFYIHLNIMVGGRGIFKDENPPLHGKPWTDNDTKAMLRFWEKRNEWLPSWTSAMEIDYVKVWAL